MAFIFAEIWTRDGFDGIGFGYSKRAGGPGTYAHAKKIAANLFGEDRNDIASHWDQLMGASASIGRSTLTTPKVTRRRSTAWTR